MSSVFDFEVQTIDGKPVSMDRFRGKVLLIVNTASKCGFTPQFAGLEKLHQDYAERGFAVLGFPCNQFRSQDPGSNSEIYEFCQKNYGVTFPMHARIDVNGADAHPLFEYLKKSQPGLLGSTGIKWNFTKFLVDRQGNVLQRYAPNTAPDKIAADIEKAL